MEYREREFTGTLPQTIGRADSAQGLDDEEMHYQDAANELVVLTHDLVKKEKDKDTVKVEVDAAEEEEKKEKEPAK